MADPWKHTVEPQYDSNAARNPTIHDVYDYQKLFVWHPNELFLFTLIPTHKRTTYFGVCGQLGH